MALSLRRRRPSKLERARTALTALTALRVLGARRVLTVAGVAALAATILTVAKRRAGSEDAHVHGAPATEAAAPVPPQNGVTAAADPMAEARAAAASLTPQLDD